MLAPSELILNQDGSIYHLNLLPEDIAPTVITVGDPERVNMVSKHFDTIEVKKGKREFHTHTGVLNGKRITVISTGIGTDNIDIVLNELDALVNVDFDQRIIKEKTTSLDIIRIGTSGAIQDNIPVDSFLLSEYAIGFDGLLHFYKSDAIRNLELEGEVNRFFIEKEQNLRAYAIQSNTTLAEKFVENRIRFGITVTNSGFYAPQSRKIRLAPRFEALNQHLKSVSYKNKPITNLEMETAGIYGLAKLLGHRSISLNAILANRATNAFSKKPATTVENLIKFTLEKLTL